MNNRIVIMLVIYLLSFTIIPISIIPLSNADISNNKWINENTYQVKEGVIEVYLGSMAYFDSNINSYQKIDTSIQQNLTHYFAEKGIYKFYISKNLVEDYPFVIVRDTSILKWKPINFAYIDISNYNIQKIRNLNISSQILIDGSEIIFKQFFEKNIDFKIIVGTDTLKEELIINNVNLPLPSNYGMLNSSTFVGIISNYTKNNINFKDSNLFIGNYSTYDNVYLTKDFKTKIEILSSIAWDNQTNNLGIPSNIQKVKNIFIINNGFKIGSGVPYNWLKSTIGKVIIGIV